jgi:hypothetical protein
MLPQPKLRLVTHDIPVDAEGVVEIKLFSRGERLDPIIKDSRCS